MPDWQIIIEDEDFPQTPAQPPTEPPRTSSGWRWPLLVGAIVLTLLTIGLLALRQQRLVNQASLREDLTAHMFAEATLWAQGDISRAVDLIVPDAPRPWRQSYLQAFTSAVDRPQPGDGVIQIADVDFDGRCALLDATIDGLAQVRTYCLRGQQWQRAPVPKAAWGSEQAVIDLAETVRLRYSPRDRALAETLARDASQLAAKVAAIAPEINLYQGSRFVTITHSLLPYYYDVTVRPTDLAEIVIEPHDLQRPLLADEGERIVLNSPLVVSLVGTDRASLSPEAAVRLALAEALLQRAEPPLPPTARDLPGAARFLKAARTVAAMHFVLPPEAQEDLLTHWRTQLHGEWISPLFAADLSPTEPPPEAQAEVAARFLADYIYLLQGLEGLLQLIQQLPETSSWDVLFQATLERSAIILESEAAFYAQATAEESPTFHSLLSLDEALAPPPLPLTATLLRVEPFPQRRLFVEVPTQADPLLVEVADDTPFQALTGEAVPPDCLPPGSAIELAGRWLEARRRLLAERVTVHTAMPLEIGSAPPDTLAFLISGEPFDEQETSTTETIYPGTKSYLQARRARVAKALLAVDSRGRLHHLSALSPTLQVFSLPSFENRPQFLFRLDPANCNRDWFVAYDPAQGIRGQWLNLPHSQQWVWRADLDAPMLFGQRDENPGYTIYQGRDTFSPAPLGYSSAAMFFMGWNLRKEQLVATNSWFGETYLGFLDLTSGYIDRTPHPSFRPLREQRLSPDGNWLAHLGGIKNLFGPADRLDVLNLSAGAEATLIQLEAGQGVGPATWSLDLSQPPRLAVLSGPVTEAGDRFQPTQLLVASPEQPGEVTVGARAAVGEQLATPTFCSDGALLFRGRHGEHYRLYRQMPGQPAEILLEVDQPFWVLGCA